MNFKGQKNSRKRDHLHDSQKWEASRIKTMHPESVVEPFLENFDTDHIYSDFHLVVKDAEAPFMKIPGSMYEKYSAAVPGAIVSKKNKANSYVETSFSNNLFKDPSSNISRLAITGSSLVNFYREIKGQAKKLENLKDRIVSQDQEARHYVQKSLMIKNNDQNEENSIKEQRESLPIFSVKKNLVKFIKENNVCIIVGETGSGKTTQLTQYILESKMISDGTMIACTQPRRVAAVSVAKRVSQERKCILGSEVGYSIRFEDQTSSKTRIKYMTDGVLLRECLKDPDLEAYSVIILDEAHERSLQTDVLLGLLRNLLFKRRDLKVIVTSATMNAEKFSNFFGKAPVFNIPGRTFPVQIVWSRSSPDDYVDAVIKQILQIHLNQPFPLYSNADIVVPGGDILVFLTGQEDIDVTCELLSQKLSNHPQVHAPLAILPIYSQLQPELQSLIFERFSCRKCILATNIAETSLTLDGVTYVIDSGLAKIKVYNPRIGMDALQIAPISQAAASQRAGRAGRTGPGWAFRCYTEQTFKSDFFPNPIPEIQRTNLSNVILLLKSLGIENILQFDWVDAPPVELSVNAIYHLWAIKALDDEANMSSMGRIMVDLPIDPILSAMLVTSANCKYPCTEEILTIVSMLSVPPVFYRPRNQQEKADAVHEQFLISDSDHLTLLVIYTKWVKSGYAEKWAEEHFLNPRSMLKASEIRSQLLQILSFNNIPLKSSGGLSFPESMEEIKKVIASASILKAARMRSIGQYNNLRTGIPCYIHPSSSVYGMGDSPEFVVYHELVMTKKEYMQCVTAIDPCWLAELANHFYGVRSCSSKNT